MKQNPNNTMGARGRRRTYIYEVDGKPVSFTELRTEAQAAGIKPGTLRNRLGRGDNTRERLFRPAEVSPGVQASAGKRARDKAEVDAACAALDSRPRNWTGY